MNTRLNWNCFTYSFLGEQRNGTAEHWVPQGDLGGLCSVQWRQLWGSLQAYWGQGQVWHLCFVDLCILFCVVQGCTVCWWPHLWRRAQVQEAAGLENFPHCARAQWWVPGTCCDKALIRLSTFDSIHRCGRVSRSCSPDCRGMYLLGWAVHETYFWKNFSWKDSIFGQPVCTNRSLICACWVLVFNQCNGQACSISFFLARYDQELSELYRNMDSSDTARPNVEAIKGNIQAISQFTVSKSTISQCTISQIITSWFTISRYMISWLTYHDSKYHN